MKAHGAIAMANPLGSSPAVAAEGKQLFRQMNCAGCHGYDGGGGMGPPLNDSYWRYGGAPVQIYKTLFEGRPQGMPAWGVALPPDKLWELTAYVVSLGGSDKAAQADSARAGDHQQGSTSRAGSPVLEGQ
jgi:cytochrome c oxidase cbb3-type subunit 3